jgi:hypothetical protein
MSFNHRNRTIVQNCSWFPSLNGSCFCFSYFAVSFTLVTLRKFEVVRPIKIRLLPFMSRILLLSKIRVSKWFLECFVLGSVRFCMFWSSNEESILGYCMFDLFTYSLNHMGFFLDGYLLRWGDNEKLMVGHIFLSSEDEKERRAFLNCSDNVQFWRIFWQLHPENRNQIPSSSIHTIGIIVCFQAPEQK